MRALRGEERHCKHCNITFCRWDELCKHQSICEKRLHGAPRPCKFCGGKFKLKDMTTHHRECDKHFKNTMVTCQICKEEVNRLKIKFHCKNNHNGNTLLCPTCGVQVKSSVMLQRHVQQIHQDERGKDIEQWAAEGKILVDRDAPKTKPLRMIEPLTLDERTKDRRGQFQCAICNVVIAGGTAFSHHINREHDGKRFICDICPFSSGKAISVYDHRLKVHDVLSGDWTLYQCQIGECRLKTVNHFAIVTHVRQTHLRIDEFPCQVCSKVFYSNGSLKGHTESVHMGIKKYPCTKCDIQCQDQRSLNLHLQTHMVIEDRDTVVCDECGGNFMNIFALRHHVKRVHRGEKKAECPHCPGKMFYCTSLMKRHLRQVHQIQVAGKNYICQKCNRHFQGQYQLDRHIQVVHLKIKPFKCKLCNTFFSKAFNLTRHIGVKHLVILQSTIKFLQFPHNAIVIP